MNRRFNVYRRDSERDSLLFLLLLFFENEERTGIAFHRVKIKQKYIEWTKIYRDQSGSIEM